MRILEIIFAIYDKLSEFILIFSLTGLLKNYLKFLLTTNNMCIMHKYGLKNDKKWTLKGKI